MNKLRSVFAVLLLFILISPSMIAQEMDCFAVVNSQKIQDMDPSVFKNLENAIIEFVNNRKWTDDEFLQTEKISCSFLINLESRSQNSYNASLQVQSTRPIYGTNYNSTMFVVNDVDFSFTYVDQQPLDFNIQSFQSNLTSVLAFYVYFIIGMDYDTFSPSGGTKYYQNAFEIVNNAQSGGGAGWKPADGNSNRYWLIENMTNSIFIPFREMLYEYHRMGLDAMKDSKSEGEQKIYDSIQLLLQVHKVRPSSFLFQVYFNAKSDELVNIFNKSEESVKNKIVPWLILIDPGNTKKYNKIKE